MFFIKNNMNYACSFVIKRDGKNEEKIVFDCFRQYSDTGNIATTGVTPISNDLLDYLKNNIDIFKSKLAQGQLTIQKESGAVNAYKEVDKLAQENAQLKAELLASRSKTVDEDVKKVEALSTENEKLKAELEALKKEIDIEDF